jgi:hypothetical protein
MLWSAPSCVWQALRFPDPRTEPCLWTTQRCRQGPSAPWDPSQPPAVLTRAQQLQYQHGRKPRRALVLQCAHLWPAAAVPARLQRRRC